MLWLALGSGVELWPSVQSRTVEPNALWSGQSIWLVALLRMAGSLLDGSGTFLDITYTVGNPKHGAPLVAPGSFIKGPLTPDTVRNPFWHCLMWATSARPLGIRILGRGPSSFAMHSGFGTTPWD